jgi:hypothetical protein
LGRTVCVDTQEIVSILESGKHEGLHNSAVMFGFTLMAIQMFVELQFLILVRAASNFTQKLPAEFTNVSTLLEELQLTAFTVTVSLEALTECWVSVLL